MSKSEIVIKAAFGATDREVRLYFVVGMGHPLYKMSINGKAIGSIDFTKLTTGGPPEEWICRFNDKYKDLFTSDDCQILIDIASKHYEENRSELYRRSYY